MDQSFINGTEAVEEWKNITLGMINCITNRDYYSLQMENNDLKKQYKMAIAALDSMITEKDNKKCTTINVLENKDKQNIEERVSVKTADEVKEISNKPLSITNLNQNKKDIETVDKKNEDLPTTSEINATNSPEIQTEKTVLNFKMLQKKFNSALQFPEKTNTVSFRHQDKQIRIKKDDTKCIKNSTSPINNKKDLIHEQNKNEMETIQKDYNKLEKKLEEANENNKRLKEELKVVKEENCELHDQIHSLELSLKTLTEAINLQDEQLSEYAVLVTSLKKSRSLILDKMKETNSRNSYNIMIMSSVEQEVIHLKRQLDAYNELLTNQTIQQIDKASITEHKAIEKNISYEDIVQEKNNYITLLHDRLCEAIVDLKNKDSEIKNHSGSIKSLIDDYELEKQCLEERLKYANVSTEKLEEHKLKQHETMKQLMKLIEFLQGKLEKMKKK